MIDPRLRQYAVTGGRTRSAADLPLEAPITARGDVPSAGTPEQQAILHHCQTPQTIVDLSAAMGAPVGVLRVLVLDLADGGALNVHHDEEALAPHQDLELLQEALDGIANL